MVVCADIASPVGRSAVILVDDVYAGVDHNAGQHDHRRESSLVERRLRQSESQEDTDKRDRYKRDDGQRLQQGLEKHGADHVDDGRYQYQEQPLLLGFLGPVILGRGGLEAYGQDP